MRRLIYLSLLMGTTFLCSTGAAHADPISALIGGFLTAQGFATAGGAVAGIFGGFAGGAFAAGYAIGSSVILSSLVTVGLSLGFSYLASLLKPRPDAPNPNAKLVNIRQPISFMEYAYGIVRKGGPVNFWKAKRPWRYIDIILAAHMINGVIGYYADEREVTRDVDGYLLQDNYNVAGKQRVQIVPYLGAPGQISPPMFNTEFTQWTDDHDMEGLAHLACRARSVIADQFSKPYPTGREPVFTALLEGKIVYDPRIDDDVFSENAALIIADWVVSEDGLGRTVDWNNVSTQADIADIPITDRDGNIRPKWKIGGSYSAGDDRETVRAQMGVAADAFFSEDENGNVIFAVGGWQEPEITIRDSDIFRIAYAEGQAGTDIVNAQSVAYTEPELGWREGPSAPYIITDPSEAYSENSLQVFWINNHNQAVRVAKRLLTTARAQYRITATLKAQGVRLLGQRFFQLAHSEMGVDMAFEVDKLSRNEDGLTYTLEAHSVTEADFEFNSAVEEPEKPRRETFEVNDELPEPANVTATAEPYGGGVSILVDWDDEPDYDSLTYRVRYRVKSPVGDWFVVSVPLEQSYQRLVGLVDGETYQIQVQAVSADGTATLWVPNNGGDEDDPTLEETVVIDPVAPAALTAFTVNAGPHLGNAVFTITTPNDSHQRAVTITRTVAGGVVDPVADAIATLFIGGLTTQGYTDGDSTRVNFVDNGDFATVLTPWTGTNWAQSAGTALHTPGSTSQLQQGEATIDSASVVRASYDIIGRTAGSVAFGYTSTPNTNDVTRSTNGTFRCRIGPNTISSPGTSVVRFSPLSTFDGAVDNVIAYIESGSCVTQGVYDYRAYPKNGSGVAGTPTLISNVIII